MTFKLIEGELYKTKTIINRVHWSIKLEGSRSLYQIVCYKKNILLMFIETCTDSSFSSTVFHKFLSPSGKIIFIDMVNDTTILGHYLEKIEI